MFLNQETIFVQAFLLNLVATVRGYPKVAISKHFTVNQADTLIKAQSLI
jgi:hypothetical protein